VPQCRIIECAAMTRFTLIALLGLVTTIANAEPLPYPKPRHGQCTGSYVQSGWFCVPKSGETVRDAIPKPQVAQCPAGWASLGSSCERMDFAAGPDLVPN